MSSKNTHWTSVMSNAMPEYTEEDRKRLRKWKEELDRTKVAKQKLNKEKKESKS